MVRFLGLMILMASCFTAMGQSSFTLTRLEIDQLVDGAISTVDKYSINLIEMGDSSKMPYEKFHERNDILLRFESPETLVLNDIDAVGNLSKEIPISTYLTDITTTRYNRHGVSFDTQIDRNLSNHVFIDTRTGGQYLFVKVVANRTIRGKDNLGRVIDRTGLIDVYVSYPINQAGYDPNNPSIYSITEHMDNNNLFSEILPANEYRRPSELNEGDTDKTPVSMNNSLRETEVKSPEPVSEVSQPRNCAPTKAQFRSASGATGHEAWEAFLYSSQSYKTAVELNGVQGAGMLRFSVDQDGMVSNPSMSFNSPEFFGKELIPGVVNQLMIESSQTGNSWLAATENCEPKQDYLTKSVIFHRRYVKSESAAPQRLDGSCNDPVPHFIVQGNMNEREAWKKFYEADLVYQNAVSSGLKGEVITRFKINSDGKVDLGSIKNQYRGVNEGDIPRIDNQVRMLLVRSQDGNGWLPAKKDCQSITGEAIAVIVFEQGDITPANRVPVIKTSTSTSKEALTKTEQKRRARQEKKEQKCCGKEDVAPKFETCKHSRRAWKEYYGKQPEYVNAVLRDKVRGHVFGRVLITENGKVDRNTVKVRLDPSQVRNWREAKSVALEIIEKSDKGSVQWKAAKSDGVTISGKARVGISFNKRSLSPDAAIASGRLNERLENKFKRKGDWIESIEGKKGGVHFSFGGLGDFGGIIEPTGSPKSQFTGGGQVAFGGLFGNVGGMEVVYSYVARGARTKDRSFISLNVLLNASPRQWNTRFYFPFGAGVLVGPFNPTRFRASLGLLCLDVKIGKKASMYFDLIKGSLEFNSLSEYKGFTINPSIGFRFSRW